jgi:hypothetical protein
MVSILDYRQKTYYLSDPMRSFIKPTKKLILDFVQIEFYTPDVVLYHYQPKTHLTWAMILEVYERTNEIIDYKPCYMCGIIGAGITIEKEVRERGTSPEMLKYTKATAIVQNSLAHRILANFIIRVQRPTVITKAFTETSDALTWFDKLRELEKKTDSKRKDQNQLVL